MNGFLFCLIFIQVCVFFIAAGTVFVSLFAGLANREEALERVNARDDFRERRGFLFRGRSSRL